MGKVLLAIALLVATNLGTFVYATWRCRQEAQGQERLLATAAAKEQETQARLQALQQRVDRLQVWGRFLELQQDVNSVHAAMNRLNFGTAIEGVDRIQRRLELGEYGQVFQQRRAELLPLANEAKLALRRTDPMARTHLVELDQRAFQILAGATAPGDFVAPLPTPIPEVMASPTPLAEPTPTPTGSLAPTPTPSPTASPAPSPKASPSPTKSPPEAGVL